MSLTLVRARNAVIAFEIETTPGTDAIGGTPSAAQTMPGDFEFDYDPQIIENPEFTGSLDKSASVVGGLRPNIRLRFPLRSSGAGPNFPAEWSPLLRVCGYAVAAPAATVAGTNATAGTTNTATAATPFGTTAQQYRGSPLVVTGGQNFTTGIINYTAGRVITIAETRAVALGVTANLAIPPHCLWSPTSDETIYKNGTLYLYKDGFRWNFVGAVGTFSLEFTAGEFAYITFNLRAQFVSKTGGVAVPAISGARAVPRKWVLGQSKLNGVVARVRRLVINAGVEVTLPDNPEAAEGFDPGVPVLRNSNGTIDPLLDTGAGTTLFDNFRLGTPMPLLAQIGPNSAGDGNRFMVTCPAVRATGIRYNARDGLEAQELTFQCDGPDAGVFLAQF